MALSLLMGAGCLVVGFVAGALFRRRHDSDSRRGVEYVTLEDLRLELAELRAELRRAERLKDVTAVALQAPPLPEPEVRASTNAPMVSQQTLEPVGSRTAVTRPQPSPGRGAKRVVKHYPKL
jgi:hypothetical protein